MSEMIVSPSPEFQSQARISSFQEYERLYKRSIEEPEAFWEEIAKTFYWLRSWTKVREYDFLHEIAIRWFLDGQTNLAYNALDFQIDQGRGDKVAILWEGNEPGVSKRFTYKEVLAEVCRWSNFLKARGLHKGDRVTIYMPMIPDLAFSMLACARLGLIHSIVFGGFSAESLSDRILDAKSDTVLTADAGFRGNKPILLKDTVDEAIQRCQTQGHHVRQCLVVRHAGDAVSCKMLEGRDVWANEEIAKQAATCPPVWVDSEDPLFILYTSGSTGKPKGVLHTTGGYMVFAATTFKYVFDHRDDDIFWCTADIGWITGHSYIVYGPLCNGATTLMFEGIPTYPDPGRFWDVVEKYKVTTFYTAPTAIRSLERFGEAPVLARDLSSLRLLGSVGEPINPEAWLWYYRVVGKERCPIVDTWWQTETGGILITTLPGAMAAKPGKAGLPMFGVQPAIVNERGEILEGETEGILTLLEPWPSLMRTVYGQHTRFKDTYFSMFPGKYFTGDGCFRDHDGYYRITGRVDDVINVSGHRLGTAEIESALGSHPKVVESAVVGYPHDIKGQGIYAYVTLLPDAVKDAALIKELKEHVRQVIGPIASPDVIHWADALPKTRSGKIMRRILRKIASDEISTLGDTSTLADPSVVETLIQTRPR